MHQPLGQLKSVFIKVGDIAPLWAKEKYQGSKDGQQHILGTLTLSQNMINTFSKQMVQTNN